MPNVRYDTDDYQEFDNLVKDIGKITKVIEKPFENITDNTIKSVYLYSKPRSVHLYDVQALTRSINFTEIPSFVSKNDISVFEEEDIVLIEYLGTNRRPFISRSISLYPSFDELGGSIVKPVNKGERLISTSAGNSIHLRSDGAIVISGGFVLRSGEEGRYTKDTPFHFILGGRQGIMRTNENSVVITLQDKLGAIFQIDSEGNMVVNRPSITLQTSELLLQITSELKSIIGIDSTKDDYRQGTVEETVHDTKTETIDRGLEVNVGSLASDATQRMKDAKAIFNIAKELKFIIGTGDNKREIIVKQTGIELGEGATELIPRGFALLTAFNKHTHPTPQGPSGPPVEQMIKEQILSEKNITTK